MLRPLAVGIRGTTDPNPKFFLMTISRAAGRLAVPRGEQETNTTRPPRFDSYGPP